MDLIDRNLILVKRFGTAGKIKACNIHDLTRDLCIMEAEREKFLCPVRKPGIKTQCEINSQRRIAIHGSGFKGKPDLHRVLDAIKTYSRSHSLPCEKDVPVALPRMLQIPNMLIVPVMIAVENFLSLRIFCS